MNLNLLKIILFIGLFLWGVGAKCWGQPNSLVSTTKKDKSLKKPSNEVSKTTLSNSTPLDLLNFRKQISLLSKELKFEQMMLLSKSFIAQLTKESQVDSVSLVEVYYWLGKSYLYNTNFDLSLDALQKSFKITLNLPNLSKSNPKNLIQDLSFVYSFMGQHHLALMYQLQCNQLNDQKVNPTAVLHQLNSLAIIYQHLGEFELAQACFDKGLNLLKEMPQYHAYIVGNIAELKKEQKQYKEAEKLLLHSIQLNQQHSQNPDFENKSNYINLGDLFLLQKNYPASLEYFHKARMIYEANFTSKHLYRVSIYQQIASVYKSWNKLDSALNYCEKAIGANLKYADILDLETIPSKNEVLSYSKLKETLGIQTTILLDIYAKNPTQKEHLDILLKIHLLIEKINQNLTTQVILSNDMLNFANINEPINQNALDVCWEIYQSEK